VSAHTYIGPRRRAQEGRWGKRCVHGFRERTCVVPRCAHYDGGGPIQLAEQPRRKRRERAP